MGVILPAFFLLSLCFLFKEDNQEEIKQELREIGERNEVEGKFGTGKRRYGLGLIKAKLQETTQADIGMNLFVENMEHQIREDLGDPR